MNSVVRMTLVSACMMLSTVFVFSQIPNESFENWTNGSNCNSEPVSWGTINSQICLLGSANVLRVSGADARTGSYAVRVVTRYIGFPVFRTAPGPCVTGRVNTSNETTEGGFPYTSRPQSLSGYYMYDPNGTDNCVIDVELWRWNGGVKEVVGSGSFTNSSSVATYTRFDAMINYTSSANPDSGKITLMASDPATAGQSNDGTMLTVDDVFFVDCSTLSVSLSTTPVSTVGGADGTATATENGGTAPYSYFWSPSAQATQTIINLGAGSYCVTVSDANGCTTTTACATVSGPDCSGLSVAVSAVDATTTNGTDGSATATASGSVAPYTYSWTTGDTTNALDSLAKGVYCVTVTDAVGCAVDTCVTVSDPGCAGFSLNVTGVNVSTVGGADGEATAAVSGETQPVTYIWDDPNNQTTVTATGLSVGTYRVTATDGAGCQQTGQVTLIGPECSAVEVTVTGTDITTVDGTDGTASAAPVGTAPYSYQWSNGDSSQSISDLSEGEHCVTLTDAVGCTATDCLTLNDPDCSGFEVSVTTTDETIAGENDGTASASAFGGSSVVAYSWSNTDTGANLTGLSPGYYCVTATDDQGCTATACDSVRAGYVGVIDFKKAGVNLFPVPAKEAITIELTAASEHRLRLFDLRGKAVMEKMLNVKSSLISLAALPAGSYIMELTESHSGKIVTGKIVKE